MQKGSRLRRAFTALFLLALAPPAGSVRAGSSFFSGDGELDGESAERSEGHRDLQGFLAGAEKLRSLAPSVRCDGDAMTLRLRGRRDSGVLVDQAGGPPVPLSQLPPDCGFSLRRSRRELLLVAPYDGCHVAQEDGRYVLPLRVHGAPVKMSCPAIPRSPAATVSCKDSEMVVQVEGASAHEVRVKVGGSWESLLSVCDRCASSVYVHHGHLLITVPYASACLETEEAGLTLRLLTTSGEAALSCPPPSDNEDEDYAGPAYPMFPPYYPMSFYPVGYPAVAPTAPRPSYPRYPFYPMGFPYMYPQAPLHVPAKATSQRLLYPGYPLVPLPYAYRYPKVFHHHDRHGPFQKKHMLSP